MIPQVAITQWSNTVPWSNMHQVEQDLILSRALVEIYSDDLLSSALAFRGGTALHKLYLSPQSRYSEDLDFVQVKPEPIGATLDRLRDVLSFLGEPKTKRKLHNNVMLFSFETTFVPAVELRIKIEINCKEHFTQQGFAPLPFSVENLWFSGGCEVLSYHLEELMGTKLRALYQRRKGRDLFDLAYTLDAADLSIADVMECYRRYMTSSDNHLPTASEFTANLKAKIADPAFRDDVLPMLRAEIDYDADDAYRKVSASFISLM